MAAVMKAVLAVESGIIPPTLGLQKPNPKSMISTRLLRIYGTNR